MKFVIISVMMMILLGESTPARATWRKAKSRLKSDLIARQESIGKVNPADDSTGRIYYLNVFFWPTTIIQFDEVHQILTTMSTFILTWRDQDLAWDISEYENIDSISEALENVWHPALAIPNSANDNSLLLESHLDYVTVHHDGSVHYFTSVYLDTFCNLDLTSFPFDEQKCTILILPFVEDANYSLSVQGFKYDPPFVLLGEWMISNQSLDLIDYVAFDGNQLQLARASLTLRRRSTYYIFSIVLPQVFMSLMTPIVFWIPPASGERMSFLVSTFLSMTVFLSYLVGTMPHSMNHLPKLLIFSIITMAQTFLSILATVVVMSRHETEKARAKVKQRHMTPESELNGSVHYVRTKARKNQVMPEPLCHLDPTNQLSVDQDSSNRFEKLEKRILKSKKLDRLFFAVYYLITIPLYIAVFLM